MKTLPLGATGPVGGHVLERRLAEARASRIAGARVETALAARRGVRIVDSRDLV